MPRRKSLFFDANSDVETPTDFRSEAQGLAEKALVLHRKHIARVQCASYSLNLLIVVTLGVFAMLFRGVLREQSAKVNDVVHLTDNVQYYDEALTMSARLAASSGDATWVNRYNTFVGPIDTAIEDITKAMPDEAAMFLETTNAANIKLIAMETIVLDEVLKGPTANLSYAVSIMQSSQYDRQKAILLQGLQMLRQRFDAKKDAHLHSVASLSWVALGVVVGCAVLYLTLGTFLVWLTYQQSQNDEKLLFKMMVRMFNRARATSAAAASSAASPSPPSTRGRRRSSLARNNSKQSTSLQSRRASNTALPLSIATPVAGPSSPSPADATGRGIALGVIQDD